MKYIITESQIDKAVFKYLDNQDFIQIKYGENIYIVNSEKDEYAQIGYNVRNGWCVISYDLLEEVVSFFPLSFVAFVVILKRCAFELCR